MILDLYISLTISKVSMCLCIRLCIYMRKISQLLRLKC